MTTRELARRLMELPDVTVLVRTEDARHEVEGARIVQHPSREVENRVAVEVW